MATELLQIRRVSREEIDKLTNGRPIITGIPMYWCEETDQYFPTPLDGLKIIFRDEPYVVLDADAD